MLATLVQSASLLQIVHYSLLVSAYDISTHPPHSLCSSRHTKSLTQSWHEAQEFRILCSVLRTGVALPDPNIHKLKRQGTHHPMHPTYNGETELRNSTKHSDPKRRLEAIWWSLGHRNSESYYEGIDQFLCQGTEYSFIRPWPGSLRVTPKATSLRDPALSLVSPSFSIIIPGHL